MNRGARNSKKSCARFQIFKISKILWQDFKAKKLRDIRNKMLSIRRSMETFVSKDFRKGNRLKPYESFWCSIRDAEYAEVYIKYTEFYSNFSDFEISTRF